MNPVLTPELAAKRRAFVEETAAHYNSKNRSMNTKNGACMYSPAHAGTEGCAIGRKVADKNLCRTFDEQYCNSAVSATSVFTQLPPELQELGVDFLDEVQLLHDETYYWCEGGLNASGREVLGAIISRHCAVDEGGTK